MPNEEWVKTLADGRRVKFTNQELLEDEAFITAQIEGNNVVYATLRVDFLPFARATLWT